MGKIESLQKKIDQVSDKVRHLRYVLLVLMSAIIGLIFGVSQNKVIDNIATDTFFILGSIIIISIGFMIKKEEDKRNELILELEHVKD